MVDVFYHFKTIGRVKRNSLLDTLVVFQVLNKAQLAKVQTAAKELRKAYCKKVMEKLCILMKATLKQLAKHFQVIQALLVNPFQAAAVESGTEVELEDDGPLYSEGDIIFVLETFLR